jgi:predicted sulfurtransferase
MPCGQEMWLQARNSTDACPHPPIVICSVCRGELCSAHIIECEVCEDFICSDCQAEHYRQHELKARQLRRAS